MRTDAVIYAKLEEVKPLALPGRIALCCTNIHVVIATFSLAPALPAIKVLAANSPWDQIGVALVGSIAGFTFALTSLLCGGMSRRLGYRRILLWSLMAYSLVGLAGMASPNLVFFLFTRAIVGVAAAVLLNASLYAVGSVVPEPMRAALLSAIVVAASVAGLFIFPAVGMLSALSWRLAPLPHVLGLVMLPLAATLPYQAPKPPVTTEPKPRPLGFDLVCLAMLGGVGSFINAVFGSLHLMDLGVRDAFVLSLPATVSSFGSILGSVSSFTITRIFRLKACIGLVLLLIAIGLLVQGLAVIVPLFLIGTFTAGVGAGLMGPSLQGAAIMRSPDNPGPTLGLANGVYFASMVLFPLIAVPLAQQLGGIAHAIVGVAALCALAALVLVLRFPAKPAQL